MWWLVILIIGGFFLVSFVIEREKMLKTAVDKHGGLQNKYPELISWMTDHPNAKITKVTRQSIEIRCDLKITFTEFIILQEFNRIRISWEANLGVLGMHSNTWIFKPDDSEETIIEVIGTYINSIDNSNYVEKHVEEETIIEDDISPEQSTDSATKLIQTTLKNAEINGIDMQDFIAVCQYASKHIGAKRFENLFTRFKMGYGFVTGNTSAESIQYNDVIIGQKPNYIASNIDKGIFKDQVIQDGKGYSGIRINRSTRKDVESVFGSNFELLFHGGHSREMVYRDLGISFYWKPGYSRLKGPESQKIFSIEFYFPFKGRTEKGISIGKSTVRDVIAHYGEGEWTGTISGEKLFLHCKRIKIELPVDNSIPEGPMNKSFYLDKRITKIICVKNPSRFSF